jgi:hypothetical protein
MNEIDEIELGILEEIVKDINGIDPEYIIDYIEERIDIIKYGF